jgi:D-beta-D-heptose 7-phosphate kinase / D-beta-D-heptose 1-phosphate adenosyltransferase
MSAPLLVVGDALLDRDISGRVERVAPDAPIPVVDEESVHNRPGGAALAACLAVQDGRAVTLVTALGKDIAGRELARMLASRGVQVIDLGSDGPTPEKVRVYAQGRPLLRLDRGGGRGGIGALPEAGREALARAGAVLVSDYGRGVASAPDVRAALTRVARSTPIVWDPHPRGAVPVAGCRLVTPNRSEAKRFGEASLEGDLAGVAARARQLADRWSVRGVVVTLGADGALLVDAGGRPLVIPARFVAGDPCGAGDRFASRAAGCLAEGADAAEAVLEGVRAASRFVAAGGAMALAKEEASFRLTARPGGLCTDAPTDPGLGADALAKQVHALGGSVVATGGCFDVLHAGHVMMLQAARALGDCLIVCLNADASVERLKGPGRPLNAAADRRDVLLALACVDEVYVFDEDTPRRALERLRPHVWVKAADYQAADLPEATVLLEWGGQAVIVPYLKDHSTTRLVQEVLRRASH